MFHCASSVQIWRYANSNFHFWCIIYHMYKKHSYGKSGFTSRSSHNSESMNQALHISSGYFFIKSNRNMPKLTNMSPAPALHHIYSWSMATRQEANPPKSKVAAARWANKMADKATASETRKPEKKQKIFWNWKKERKANLTNKWKQPPLHRLQCGGTWEQVGAQWLPFY